MAENASRPRHQDVSEKGEIVSIRGAILFNIAFALRVVSARKIAIVQMIFLTNLCLPMRNALTWLTLELFRKMKMTGTYATRYFSLSIKICVITAFESSVRPASRLRASSFLMKYKSYRDRYETRSESDPSDKKDFYGRDQ